MLWGWQRQITCLVYSERVRRLRCTNTGERSHHFGDVTSHGLVLPMSQRPRIVELDCGEVLRNLSNYLGGDLSPELLVQIDSHLVQCRRCTAVSDGTRNVLMLLIHPTTIALPEGFSQRLYERLVMSSGVPE
jgi:hypothetical protein